MGFRTSYSGALPPALPGDGNTVFVFDPDDITNPAAPTTHTRLTIVGGAVTACTDAAGGSIVLAAGGAGGPTYDTTNLVNGHPTVTTSATGEQLTTTTAGPVWGNTPFTMYSVGAAVSPSVGTYPAFAIVGQPDSTLLHLAWTGGFGLKWLAGVYDNTTDALGPASPAVDSNPCLLSMEYDGAGNVVLRRNGIRLATGTVTGTPAIVQGFGLSYWHPSFKTGVHYAWSTWRKVLDTTATRQQIERYAAERYGLLQSDLVMCIGDSLTFGLGGSTSYPSALSSALSANWGATVTNVGVTGFTTAQILANMTAIVNYDVITPPSGARRNNFAIVLAGANNILSNTSTAAQAVADLTNIKADLQALGYTVLMGTLFPWVNGSPAIWDQAKADAINTGIRSLVPAKYLIEFALMPQMQLVSNAYQSAWRNTVSNVGHPTTQGYAAMARLVEDALWVARQ